MKLIMSRFALVLIFLLVFPLSVRVSATNDPASQAVSYVDNDEVVYALWAVNIRTGPGTENPIIGVLRPGKCIRRIAIGSNGWSRVMFQGKQAYIHSSYLTATHVPMDPPPEEAALLSQISAAYALDRADYTVQSWGKVTAAIDKGCDALGGTDPNAVDAAAQDLKTALETLVKMDYAQLEAALSRIPTLQEGSNEGPLWLSLMEARENGIALLQSGDQGAVDDASRQINELIAQIAALPDDRQEPETVIQEVLVEVPVEVPFPEDYCNDSAHRVKTVLLFISAGLNLTLGAIFLISIAMKQHKHRDNTPLVDYDISDDTM